MNRTYLKQALVVTALAVVPMAANSADFELVREMSRSEGCPYGEAPQQAIDAEEFSLAVISTPSDEWFKAEMARSDGNSAPNQPPEANAERLTKGQ